MCDRTVRRFFTRTALYKNIHKINDKVVRFNFE